MGTAMSRAERRRRDTNRNSVVDDAVQRLERKREKRLLESQGRPASNALVPHRHASYFQDQLESTKIEQLKKGGAALTKADLLAIVFRLENRKEDETEMFRLQSLRVPDLCAYIRVLLYSEREVPAPREDEFNRAYDPDNARVPNDASATNQHNAVPSAPTESLAVSEDHKVDDARVDDHNIQPGEQCSSQPSETAEGQ